MDAKQAESWLTWLYGDAPASRIWIGGHADGFVGQTFNTISEAVAYAATLEAAAGDQPWGVYHRLTQVSALTSGRGSASDSTILDAVAIDLDLGQTGHKAANYPPDEASLHVILKEAELPAPTAWVNSGAGRYAFWKLAEPIALADDDTRAEVADAVRAVHRRIRDAAAAHGWKLDNTSDLARVYRLPGTTNRKPGVMTPAAWCGPDTGARFTMADLNASTPVAAPSSLFADTYASSEIKRSTVNVEGSSVKSSLFAQPSELRDPMRERTFTTAEAMAFVKPFLDALAAAPDGEINVRLNDAACALAHFGEEFWDADAADRQLYAALDATAYDGMTWKAEDTIASARRGMASDWRAVRVPDAVEAGAALESAVAAAPVDAIDALIGEMLSLDELESAPPPKFMIHKFLQFDSESWMIGAPGSKKSFVAFDMAARVVRGEPWQGFKTSPADVVFIVAEGASGHGKRVKAWRKRFGAVEAGDRQAVFTLPRPVQARDVEKWGVLVGACRKLGQRAAEAGRGLMVVIDTQARVTVGLKENDNGEMNFFVEAVSAIRRATGACVLTIHHTKKGGGDARGASVIDGAQTTELKVVSESGKLTAKLLTEKQKDVDEHEPVSLAFEVIDVGVDSEGEAVTSLVLADQGSAAFRAAWAGAEVGAEDVTTASRETNPFTVRAVIDPWIRARTDAECEQWAMQLLWDVAEDEGLTGPEVRRAVAGKLGKKSIPDGTWYEAWQRITNTTKEEGAKRRWNDVVVSAGGRRWTVDRTAEV